MFIELKYTKDNIEYDLIINVYDISYIVWRYDISQRFVIELKSRQSFTIDMKYLEEVKRVIYGK